MGSARDFFTLDTIRYFISFFVNNFYFNAFASNARPVAIPFKTALRWNQQMGAAFGGAIAFTKLEAMLVCSMDHGARNRSAAAYIKL